MLKLYTHIFVRLTEFDILEMNHILNKLRIIFRCSKSFASILVEHVRNMWLTKNVWKLLSEVIWYNNSYHKKQPNSGLYNSAANNIYVSLITNVYEPWVFWYKMNGWWSFYVLPIDEYQHLIVLLLTASGVSGKSTATYKWKVRSFSFIWT